jgi:hypothetical protein
LNSDLRPNGASIAMADQLLYKEELHKIVIRQSFMEGD